MIWVALQEVHRFCRCSWIKLVFMLCSSPCSQSHHLLLEPFLCLLYLMQESLDQGLLQVMVERREPATSHLFSSHLSKPLLALPYLHWHPWYVSFSILDFQS